MYHRQVHEERSKGLMRREDLAKNLTQHLNTEIDSYCKENGLSIHEGLNDYSPTPDYEHRHIDATEDLAVYYEVNLRVDGNKASDRIESVIETGSLISSQPKAIIVLSHLDKIFDNRMVQAVPALDGTEEARTIDSSLSRSDLNKAFNPDRVVPLEVTRKVQSRIRIANIVAGRIPVTGNGGAVPILKSVDKSGGQGTANRKLPRYGLEVDSNPLKLTEDGFEIEIDDATRRSSPTTIASIAEDVRQRTEVFENQIVNEICQDIMSGITGELAINWASGYTFSDLLEFHYLLNGIYAFTTFVGTLEGVVKYLEVDAKYEGDSEIFGRELIAKRSAADVPALGSDSDAKVGAWDRMNTFNYYAERNGSLQDAYREESDRRQVLRFVMNYGGRLRADADHCRAFLTLDTV